MTLFVILAAMALATLACVLVPLLRRQEAPRSRAEHDVEIYRDQLAEIERDHARGLLSDSQLEASRTEIGRRLLAADAARNEAEDGEGAGRLRTVFAVALAALVPLAAASIYVSQGSPGLPGTPASQTAAARAAQTARADGTTPDVTSLVERLGVRMQSRPNDARGWRLLARSLGGLGRHAEAVDAYARAASLQPSDADLLSLFGEAIAASNGGRVMPAAQQAFASALAIDPKEPRARFYLGLAARQRGKAEEAAALWRALEADSPPDAEWLPVLRQQLAELDAPARGPSRDDVETAQQMTPEERQAMIRSMVESLAARLEENPDDEEGWARLARSYRVLGEPEKALEALKQLLRLRPDDVGVLTAYAQMLLQTADGKPPPAAFGQTIGRILELDPENRPALWVAGLVAAQLGDNLDAIRHWSRLRPLLPPDSEERAELDRRIKAIGTSR